MRLHRGLSSALGIPRKSDCGDDDDEEEDNEEEDNEEEEQQTTSTETETETETEPEPAHAVAAAAPAASDTAGIRIAQSAATDKIVEPTTTTTCGTKYTMTIDTTSLRWSHHRHNTHCWAPSSRCTLTNIHLQVGRRRS